MFQKTHVEVAATKLATKMVKMAVQKADDVEIGCINTILADTMVEIQRMAAKRNIVLPTIGYFQRDNGDDYSLLKSEKAEVSTNV